MAERCRRSCGSSDLDRTRAATVLPTWPSRGRAWAAGVRNGACTTPPLTAVSLPPRGSVAFRKPSWSDDGAHRLPRNQRDGTRNPRKRKGPRTRRAPRLTPRTSRRQWTCGTRATLKSSRARKSARRTIGAGISFERGIWTRDRPFRWPEISYEQVAPLKSQPVAYVASWQPYAMERSIGRPAADLALIDLATGERDPTHRSYRRRLPSGQPRRSLSALPESRSFLDDRHSHSRDHEHHQNGSGNVRQPRVGCYGAPEAAVRRRRVDVERRGGAPLRQVRHLAGSRRRQRRRALDRRDVRTDPASIRETNPDEESIDLDKPIAVSLFGTWTKRSGTPGCMPPRPN